MPSCPCRRACRSLQLSLALTPTHARGSPGPGSARNRYHCYALVVVLLVGLRLGMTIVIQAKFELVQVRHAEP